MREQQPAISLFSVGMIGMGALSAISRDFAGAATGSTQNRIDPDVSWRQGGVRRGRVALSSIVSFRRT